MPDLTRFDKNEFNFIVSNDGLHAMIWMKIKINFELYENKMEYADKENLFLAF